jgi:uncharacterized membrane protein YjgN (DUF898 family)
MFIQSIALRGIRFGMDSAAWGFVWRAIAHSFLTIITLGLIGSSTKSLRDRAFVLVVAVDRNMLRGF